MSDNHNRLLNIQSVKDKTGFSETTIYEWIKSGYFPSSILFGEGKRKIARWLESDIDCWIDKHKLAS